MNIKRKITATATRKGGFSPPGTRGPGFILLLAALLAHPLHSGDLAGNGADSRDEIEIPQRIQWGPLIQQSMLFLGVKHSFRLATEAGTREGLRGPFFKGYAQTVHSLHGWSDGDPFHVNYLGHPLQGAVSGNIFVHNDMKYQTAEFGRNAHYWKGRLRAMAFAWAHGAQFEIGPISEATIGNIQARHPQQGFVDHVITPTAGLGWMVAEDALDRRVILAFEDRVQNRALRALVRTWVNPARSFSNLMRFERPWKRDTRAGVSRYRPLPEEFYPRAPEEFLGDSSPPWDTVAPFEFAFTGETTSFHGGSTFRPCVGGAGVAQLRLTDSLGLIGDVGGCKLLGMEPNHSGDVLNFAIGPRWTYRGAGRWAPYSEFLVGGRRVTLQEHDLVMKALMEEPEYRDLSAHEKYRHYATLRQATGLSMAFGGGLDVGLNRAASLRLANLQYTRAWLPGGDFAPYQQGVRFSFGVWLRSGTW